MTVSQNTELIIERLGKFNSKKTAGLAFILPFVDRVAAKRSMKEVAIDIPTLEAITKDNSTLRIDGVLYIRVLDSYKATYGVENYRYAIKQLAQTTLRAEIGKLDLDESFQQRERLNSRVVESTLSASEAWGIAILRFEVQQLSPSDSVLQAMEKQVQSDRERRAVINKSEGEKTAAINLAEGKKQAQVLAAEGEKMEQVLHADGEAKAMLTRAEAQAKSIEMIGAAASTPEGKIAVEFELAGKAIDVRAQAAKESTVIMLPDESFSPASLVAQGMAVMNSVSAKANG